MIGKPKFKQEDQVSFIFPVNGTDTKLNGVIYIVDPNGTIEQTEEPSYDIMAFINGETALFKHIPESFVSERVDN